MAIPNFITDTMASIEGEFADAAGPFISAENFIPEDFPSDLVAIAGKIPSPDSLNPFQIKMMQTMLTSTGRSELFKNPFSQDLVNMNSRLTAIITTPGTDGESNPLAPVAQDLMETLSHFELHTNRLCGVSEPVGDAQYRLPTLEKALAVGSSLNAVHQMMDAAPTNEPQLSLFSSFFVGRDHIEKIKSIIALPDSNISAADLTALSQNLITTIESDVKNYTVGVKKLKRISIANAVFNTKGKQVESQLFKQLTTDFTQGLFANDDSRRNDAQVKLTQARLDLIDNTRANATTRFSSREYKTLADLITYGGLFEGIPISLSLWNTLKRQYPPTNDVKSKNIVGRHIFNIEQSFSDQGIDVSDKSLFDFYNQGIGTQSSLLIAVWETDLYANPAQNMFSDKFDIYFDGVVRYGAPMSKVLTFGEIMIQSLNLPGDTDKIEIFIFDSASEPNRPATAAEIAKIKSGLQMGPYAAPDPLYNRVKLSVFGRQLDISGWIGILHSLPFPAK